MINSRRSWVGGIVDNPAEEIDPKFRSFGITIDCVAEFIMRGIVPNQLPAHPAPIRQNVSAITRSMYDGPCSSRGTDRAIIVNILPRVLTGGPIWAAGQLEGGIDDRVSNEVKPRSYNIAMCDNRWYVGM